MMFLLKFKELYLRNAAESQRSVMCDTRHKLGLPVILDLNGENTGILLFMLKISSLKTIANTKTSQCSIIRISATYRGNDAPHLKGHRAAESLHKDLRWNCSFSLVTRSWHPEHAILSLGQACAVISSRAATCWHPSLGHLSRTFGQCFR